MDAETFKKLFLPYHKKLYRIAYKFLENQADAEDMVQETYIKLWQKREEWEYLLNPESFAMTILKNTCLDFLRKVKPAISRIQEVNVPAMDSFITRIENKDKLSHIQAIMAELPEQQRRIIQLKIWDNLPDKEIEKLTGLTQGNIKMIVSRARKTIKKLYLKWEKDENR
jgi:RNA polymerase sigma-70 factor (ECF subfamily)